MKKTMPTPRRTVNTPAPKVGLWAHPLWQPLALVLALCGGVAAVGYVTGAEVWVAQALYQPDTATPWGSFAWAMRQWGAALPGYVALAGLLVLLAPKAWVRSALLYQSAAVLVLAAVLGAGFFNQVVLQELTDRHRPRETVLVGTTAAQLPAELEGHSFPSGHAGIAFALAAPYFVLRRPRPKLAKGVLAAGLATGAVVGLGRMGLGAHYLSDVLVAAGISLGAGALAAPWVGKMGYIPRRWLVIAALVAGVGMVLGNSFRLQMAMELPTPMPTLDLPCVAVAQAQVGLTAPRLEVNLKGFGVPVSNLSLRQQGNTVALHKGLGLFHSLQCTATLRVPMQGE